MDTRGWSEYVRAGGDVEGVAGVLETCRGLWRVVGRGGGTCEEHWAGRGEGVWWAVEATRGRRRGEERRREDTEKQAGRKGVDWGKNSLPPNKPAPLCCSGCLSGLLSLSLPLRLSISATA